MTTSFDKKRERVKTSTPKGEGMEENY